MKVENLIMRLAYHGVLFRGLAGDLDEEQARWKPSPRSWSILEVVNHLHDEEREDFRQRLDLVLHKPDCTWPPIDPEGWVLSRGYSERGLEESLDRFLREREKSVLWLKELKSPDWERSYKHPKLGAIAAGDLMNAWTVHDYLHLKQLALLHAGYISEKAAPFSARYAMP